MGAMVAIRHNAYFKNFYERLRKSGGKCFKVAIVAVMRKLITKLNVMIKKGDSWRQPNLLPN